MIGGRATVVGVALAGLLGPLVPCASLTLEAQTPGAGSGPALELPLPPDAPASPLWLAPDGKPTPAVAAMAAAVKQLLDGTSTAATLAVFAKGTADATTGGYARVLKARAELAAGRIDAAESTITALTASHPDGYLAEAAALTAASVFEARADWAQAVRALEAAVEREPVGGATVCLRFARMRLKAGDRAGAVVAYRRVLVSFPLSPEAADASTELAPLVETSVEPSAEILAGELSRAEALFTSRRYAEARKVFEAARPWVVEGADRLTLRIAQCDTAAKKFGAARQALQALAARAMDDAVRAEARYALLATLRGLALTDEYIAATRALVASAPATPWAEPALNDLATFYILEDRDDDAARVFAEMYAQHPAGVNAERAAWRAGWFAYTRGDYAETVRLFDDAFVRFPRSDYRSAWSYWAARARQQLGQRDAALDGLRRVVALYQNSYYGREAARQLATLAGPSAGVVRVRRDAPLVVAPGAPPPNARLITRLLELGLWDEAIGEVKWYERLNGPSPVTTATLAYAWNRKGELRTAITLMRRAYPQFMAAGGETLPVPIRQVIFPIAYWDLIQKYAVDRGLDPHLMAALITQESTFQADVKSSANAWGLMQILPATGRSYATKVGVRPWRVSKLTNPDVNIRIGMAYFADLVKRYDGVVGALVAYNAGGSRYRRWVAEYPNAERDEFIDNIPFFETQNYLKRILGTADDIRVLYPRTPAVRSGAAGTR